jgi:preprotein translocase subunit SecG
MALGLVFVINTVALGYLYNQERNQSAIDSVKTETLIPSTPVENKTTAPAAPVAPSTTTEAPTVPAVPQNN